MARGKRGNGEGSITQLADGRWQARVTLEGAKRKALYGKTRAEAAAKLTAVLRDVQKGVPVVGEKQTVSQYLASWLETARTTLRPRSWIRYEEAIRLHVVPTLGKLALTKVTPQHVQALYTTKLAEGQAPASVARLHAVLRKALGDAMRMGLVQRNVATLVRAPRQRRKEQEVLTPDQVRTLFAAGDGHPLEAFFTLAVLSGMRRGELLALHWADVDLEGGTVQVKYTLDHVKGGGYTFAPPKTERSRRRVRLGALAIAALRRQRAQQNEQRLAVGAEWEDHDLVFTDATGRPLRGNHILQRQFAPLLKMAGLPYRRLHDLRHTAASLMGSEGIPAVAVSQMLGHSSVSMTFDIYSHVFPDMQKDAAAALDRLLGGRAGKPNSEDHAL